MDDFTHCIYGSSEYLHPYGDPNECHHYDKADRKTEPQYDAEEVAKDINRRVDMVKKEWEVRHNEPQTERSE
jgi:hypothetical protein